MVTPKLYFTPSCQKNEGQEPIPSTRIRIDSEFHYYFKESNVKIFTPSLVQSQPISTPDQVPHAKRPTCDILPLMKRRACGFDPSKWGCKGCAARYANSKWMCYLLPTSFMISIDLKQQQMSMYIYI